MIEALRSAASSPGECARDLAAEVGANRLREDVSLFGVGAGVRNRTLQRALMRGHLLPRGGVRDLLQARVGFLVNV